MQKRNTKRKIIITYTKVFIGNPLLSDSEGNLYIYFERLTLAALLQINFGWGRDLKQRDKAIAMIQVKVGM